MSNKQHEQNAPNQVKFAVITVSDTRTKETDKSGRRIIALLEEAGYAIQSYCLVKDDQEEIKLAVTNMINDEDIDIVITNGGTGISKRDVTIETIAPMLEKELKGFGEIFRMLSYTEDIGSAALLSRAIGGVSHGKAIFSLPGSTGAVSLAMKKLILPEVKHITSELRK